MNTHVDAESAVLGAILLSPDCMSEIQKELTPDTSDWFYEPKHNIVFNACAGMRLDGKPIDVVTLIHELEKSDEWETIEAAGGYAFISELSSSVPTTSNVRHYAAIVAESSRKRRMVDVSIKMKHAAQNGAEAAETRDAIKRDLDDIFEGHTKKHEPADIPFMFSNPAPEMDFLFDGIVPLNTLVGCDAGGGSGKGYFIQELLTSLCIGRTLLDSFPVHKRRKILWLQSEEDSQEIHRRFERISYAFELTGADADSIAENLVMYPKLAEPLNRKDEDGRTCPTQFFNWLAEEVTRVQPGLIVIDPRSHYFAGEENSNTDVAAFMNLLVTLIPLVREGCSVWVNHHSSKARQTEQGSDMGRGASAGRDAMRCLFNLTCLSPKECEAAGVGNPKLYVKLELSKSNWTAPRDGSIYLRRGGGDYGGVLKEIDLEAMKKESERAVLDHLARDVANRIGDNPNNHTIRDICKQPVCKDARDDIKQKFGKSATQAKIEEAIDRAYALEIIDFRKIQGGGRPGRVPFLIEEGK